MVKEDKQGKGPKAARSKIRIRLKGYDQRLLDRSVLDIVETAKRTGAAVGTYSASNSSSNLYGSPFAARRSEKPRTV